MLDAYEGADPEAEDKELQKLITFAQSKSTSKYTEFSPNDVVAGDDDSEKGEASVDLEKEIRDEMANVFSGKTEGLTHSDEKFEKKKKAADARKESVEVFSKKANQAIEDAEKLEKEFEKLSSDEPIKGSVNKEEEQDEDE